ncbi:MAG: hypothetical protein ISS95_00870 [Candidatus Aenigmarchaeota archaeon]|nr:hypothetical protein [Candidatus Aenigmarchaeota archaeon]
MAKKKTGKTKKQKGKKVVKKINGRTKVPRKKFETAKVPAVQEKKNSVLPALLVILLIAAAVFVYFRFSQRDVFKVHPELETNSKIMDFKNEYGKLRFKENIIKDFLYIAIYPKSMEDCIIAVENTENKVVQIIEPTDCSKSALNKLLNI